MVINRLPAEGSCNQVWHFNAVSEGHVSGIPGPRSCLGSSGSWQSVLSAGLSGLVSASRVPLWHRLEIPKSSRDRGTGRFGVAACGRAGPLSYFRAGSDPVFWDPGRDRLRKLKLLAGVFAHLELGSSSRGLREQYGRLQLLAGQFAFSMW